MSLFAYRAKGADGMVREGVIDAGEQRAAAAALRQQRLVILSIGLKEADLLERVKVLFRKNDKRVPAKDLLVFSRQFATLVCSGVPLVRGLAILERQSKCATLKEALSGVREDVEAGLSISEALQKRPDAFPALYIAMVKAGELGGILDTILDRLAAYLENAEALRAKVKSALMYPFVVAGVCGAVTVFLLVFVIPRFQAVFASFGHQLPLLTQCLIDLSTVVRRCFLAIAAAPFGARGLFLRFYATSAGRRAVDARLLDAPVFGELMRKAAIARFSRTLATLVKAGVPMLQALDTAADTAGNAVVTEAIHAARESIREGGTLNAPLEKAGVFPEMVVSMIATGEETGSLDAMLAKIADFYEQEVDADVKGLASVIEPLVIVLMSIVVGTIVIAMFLPMFDIPNIIGE